MARTIVAALFVFLSAGCASIVESRHTRNVVIAVDDARIASRTAGDADALESIYADDYVLITAEGDVRSRKDQIDELRAGQLQFQPLEIVERSVRLYGDTAIVLSRERSVIIRNGSDIGGDFRASRTYVFREKQWRLVLTHVTRVEK